MIKAVDGCTKWRTISLASLENVSISVEVEILMLYLTLDLWIVEPELPVNLRQN